MPFLAKYSGQCSDCGEPIEVGEEIQPTGPNRYEHVSCPENIEQKPSQFEGTTTEEMGY
jgi:hypothetical protein